MTRKQFEEWSHHEQLRYEYLLQNIYYLTEEQKKEFQYLQSKKQTSEQAYQNANKQPDYYQDSYETQDYDTSEYIYDEDELAVEPDYPVDDIPGLPQYYEESQPKKKAGQRLVADDLPVYQQAVKSKSKAPKPKRKKVKRPRRKRAWFKRSLQFIALVLVATLIGMAFMFIKGMQDTKDGKNNYNPAVTEVFNGKKTEDGTNILILGSDQRVTQGSADARTDTIMVANVGNKSGKIKLVSFMRDILVNIPDYSESDYDTDIKLNTAFNLGEQDDNQGAEYMRRVLKRNFDINVQYYVMVDFETFADAINTLFPNGVQIDAKFGTIDGKSVSSVEVPDDLNMKDGVVPQQKIKVGRQRMDGRTLLNYARFRKDDDGDYGRTQRQQQVLSAVVSQIKDPSKLFTGSAAIGKVFAMTSTNLSYSFLLSNGLSVVQDAQKGVEQVTVPSQGDWVDTTDMYGGDGLDIDFVKYQKELTKLGLR